MRELRKAKGWFQEEFAAECGLHRTYLGAIGRGEKRVCYQLEEAGGYVGG